MGFDGPLPRGLLPFSRVLLPGFPILINTSEPYRRSTEGARAAKTSYFAAQARGATRCADVEKEVDAEGYVMTRA